MPFTETCRMEERVRMLSDFDSGVWSVSELCRRYGVCRDTFYAWLRRRESGEEGWFIDHSHAPLHRPHATAAELKEAIVLLRRRFAHMGPRKLKAMLARQSPETEWPAASTIGDIQAIRGLIQIVALYTSCADRKRILRFIVREVMLDQKRTRGKVWLKIVWQTGATSEHHLQRRVHTHHDYTDVERLRQRITELNGAHKMDREIATILNQEGFVAARSCAFKGENVWLLRTRCARPSRSMVSARIRCVGLTAASRFRALPPSSVLLRGLLSGRQLTKDQPWQIDLSDEQIPQLRAHVRRTRRSKKEAP